MFWMMCMIIIFILSLIFVVWSLTVYLFPWFYVSELALSFLPYLIVISIIGLIFWMWRLRKDKKFSVMILLFGVIFLLFSRKFTSFYQFQTPQYQVDWTWWIKVFYANIYMHNTWYDDIKNLITTSNPDVIMFVEFAGHHYDNLKSFLQKDYPYINTTTWSQKFVGSTVFSKYKINNWADDFPQWAWRYGYFSLNHSGQNYYFYLVHTSSPITYQYFVMRNKQIQSLFDDFQLHKRASRLEKDKVIVLGDFNTSPWSVFYWRFADGFTEKFVNITRTFPLLFTWRFLDFPLVFSHIDHIFVNKQVFVHDLQIMNIPGSDHKWFLFDVK